MRWLLRILTTIMLLAAAGALYAAAADDAARSSVAIGVNAFEGGSPEAAIEALSQALQGRLTSRQAAKALYYRGRAYRALGKPGQAIADFDAAIAQRNGLSLGQLADAEQNRAAAHREAGVTAAAKAVTPAIGERPRVAPVYEQGQQSFLTTTSIDPAEPGTAWAAATIVPQAPSAFATEVTPGAVEAPTTAGGVRVQVARVQSQSEAYAVAVRVMSQHGAEFNPSMLRIVRAVVENKPPVFLVRLGPFANGEEAQKRCASLRRSGFDCVVQY